MSKPPGPTKGSKPNTSVKLWHFEFTKWLLDNVDRPFRSRDPESEGVAPLGAHNTISSTMSRSYGRKAWPSTKPYDILIGKSLEKSSHGLYVVRDRPFKLSDGSVSTNGITAVAPSRPEIVRRPRVQDQSELFLKEKTMRNGDWLCSDDDGYFLVRFLGRVGE